MAPLAEVVRHSDVDMQVLAAALKATAAGEEDVFHEWVVGESDVQGCVPFDSPKVLRPKMQLLGEDIPALVF